MLFFYRLSNDDTTITLKCSVEFEGHKVWWREHNSQDYKLAQAMEIKYTRGTKIYLRTG